MVEHIRRNRPRPLLSTDAARVGRLRPTLKPLKTALKCVVESRRCCVHMTVLPSRARSSRGGPMRADYGKLRSMRAPLYRSARARYSRRCVALPSPAVGVADRHCCLQFRLEASHTDSSNCTDARSLLRAVRFGLDLGPNSTDIGQTWRGARRIWAEFGQLGPNPAKCGQRSDDFGPVSGNFIPSSTNVGQDWPELDISWPDVGQFGPSFDPNCPNFDPNWPDLGLFRVRANAGRIRAKFGQAERDRPSSPAVVRRPQFVDP